MPSVEMHEPGQATAPQPALASPSAPTPLTANGVRYVKDARGRTIGWKRLGYLDEMRLSDFLGAATATNPAYMGPAAVAHAVVDLDGERLPKVINRLQLEHQIQRLGDDGMEALMADVRSASEATEAKVLDEVSRAKNSLGTTD